MKSRTVIFIIALVIIADQTLKIWVKTHYQLNTSHAVIGSGFQLFFVENSGSPRIVAIYKSTDNGVSFTLLQNLVTGGLTCDTTVLTINDATINKLKIP